MKSQPNLLRKQLFYEVAILKYTIFIQYDAFSLETYNLQKKCKHEGLPLNPVGQWTMEIV